MVGVMHMQVTIERTYILTGGMATTILPFPRKCPLCHYLCPSLALYISHLRLVHNGDPTFNVSCPIDCCEKPFSTFSAFNSHIYRDHRATLGLEPFVETEFQISVSRWPSYWLPRSTLLYSLCENVGIYSRFTLAAQAVRGLKYELCSPQPVNHC